jgi:hypothetical protein
VCVCACVCVCVFLGGGSCSVSNAVMKHKADKRNRYIYLHIEKNCCIPVTATVEVLFDSLN